MGSWLFLATILVPEKLNYDQLFGVTQERQQQDDVGRMVRSVSSIGTCGSCTRCLIACPTDAILAPYDLDPRRCISYWTIEAKGSIPRELRPLFANRIFGCDICQEVCPYNQRLPERTPLLQGLHAKQEQTTLPLLEGFNPAFPYWLDEAAFRQRFRGSPIRRAKRKGMLRNVCVALGNWGSPTATPALTVALSDPEDIVRGHAAWALGRVASSHQDHRCIRALATAGLTEMNDWVRSEIAAALSSVRI